MRWHLAGIITVLVAITSILPSYGSDVGKGRIPLMVTERQPAQAGFVPVALPLRMGMEVSQSGCPVELEPLMDKMIEDLPGYANRVMQRNRNGGDSFRPSNVILAGRAEFDPLPLSPGKPIPEDPRQVFITTLERTYSRDDRVWEIQHFHWVFLTNTEDGWRLALMFSSIDGARDGRPPSPPRENSRGAIAEAIRNWLRDCRARRPPRARS